MGVGVGDVASTLVGWYVVGFVMCEKKLNATAVLYKIASLYFWFGFIVCKLNVVCCFIYTPKLFVKQYHF